jgi:hypothetical protein
MRRIRNAAVTVAAVVMTAGLLIPVPANAATCNATQALPVDVATVPRQAGRSTSTTGAGTKPGSTRRAMAQPASSAEASTPTSARSPVRTPATTGTRPVRTP